MNDQGLDDALNWIKSHFFGKYPGTVVDNKDPTNRARIKVNVLSVHNDLNVWAMPCLPYTGKNVGTHILPEPGAGVWVEFAGGDPSQPIWTGGFWADDEIPNDEQGNQAKPSLRMIKSEKGLMISFNDDSETLTLSDSDGSNIMTIAVQDGKIRMQASQKVVVEAPLIELIEGSTQHLVYGEDLLNYLYQMVQIYATHTHPGELALGILPVTPMTPIPPMPVATPALLSMKVTTG
jgi:uncharacterized protein involved in type VI secretion and phage assembly